MASDIYDVLNYPQRGRNETLKRALDTLGVELIPFGKEKIFGVPVLGKGWSSVVIYGIFGNKESAVKVQRVDSNRISLRREASFLEIVNKYGIGPIIYYKGKGFLIMEYLNGTPIREAPVRKEHIISFLEQCHKLDLLKVDHGQIQGGKHLIIGENCWIIDFEKTGYRTPRNVSSLISELFLKRTEFARRMKSQFGINREELIGATHKYKENLDLKSILTRLHL
jgi:putative serine/threonine protein kinase